MTSAAPSVTTPGRAHALDLDFYRELAELQRQQQEHILAATERQLDTLLGTLERIDSMRGGRVVAAEEAETPATGEETAATNAGEPPDGE